MTSFRLASIAFLLSLLPAVCAAQSYKADYSPDPLKSLCPEWTYTINVKVKNTGTLAWTQSTFFLSYHWYDTSGNVIVADGLRTAMTVPLLKAGEEHTFLAQLKGPPGSLSTYILKWDMVIDAIGYFSQLGAATKDVTVKVNAIPCITLANASVFNIQIPNITSVWQHELNPGDVVVIGGENFGTIPGKLVLEGHAPGFPLGQVTLATPVWKDTVVGGIVPDSITKVVDQPAKLVLSRADNALSAEWPIDFFATREIRYVDADDMSTDCWQGSWKDWCNGIGERASEFVGGFNIWLCLGILNRGGAVAAPIHATHQGNPWDYGWDFYDISLRNGWLFNDFFPYIKYPGTVPFIGNTSSFPTKISIEADWVGHPQGIGRATEYCAYVEAVGPLDVPYK